MRALRAQLASVHFTHARGAPTVIVGTFKDTMPSPADWQSVDGVLADIIDTAGKELNVQGNRAESLRFFPVNNRLGCADPSVLRLRQVIDKAVRADPKNYVEQPIPLQWLRVHDELRRRARDTPHWDTVRKVSLCPEHLGVAVPDVDLLLRLLHELGVVPHYDEAGLRHTVFRTQWLVDRFSASPVLGHGQRVGAPPPSPP